MAWKLVAFDWDGTLADTTQVAYQAMRTIFVYYDAEPPTKDVFLENITSGGMLKFYHDRGIPQSATRDDLNVIWQSTLTIHSVEVPFLFAKGREKMVYVDDTFEGLSAAKAIGAAAIGITGGFSAKHRLLEAAPDHLIENLQDLLPLFGSNGAER